MNAVIWKTVPDHPDYKVSNTGLIRNGIEPVATYDNGNGYIATRLNGQKHYVHRIVASAFIGNCEGMDINHMNGDKADNRVENLEIVTRSENMAHARAMGLHNNYAEGHYQSKLTAKAVRYIRSIYPKLNFTELGNKFGVSDATIRDAYHKRTWKSVE